MIILIGVVVSCKPENIPPVARLVITPAIGDSLTVFYFDARNTTDENNYLLSLQVRWDWDGDGYWDTDFSANKEEVRRFSEAGYHHVRMQVTDLDGLVSTVEDSIYLFEQNPYLDSMTDPRDQQVYRIARINGYWIMTENLRYGIAISDSVYPGDNQVTEFHLFNNSAENMSYGGLYTWDEVMVYNYRVDNQEICPPGWHVPSAREWRNCLAAYPNHGANMDYYLGPGSPSGFNLEFYGSLSRNLQTGRVYYPGFTQSVDFWCSDPPENHWYLDERYEFVSAVSFWSLGRNTHLVEYRPVDPPFIPVRIISHYLRCFKNDE